MSAPVPCAICSRPFTPMTMRQGVATRTCGEPRCVRALQRQHPGYWQSRRRAGVAGAAARKAAALATLLARLEQAFGPLSEREQAIAVAAKGGR